VVLGSAFAVGVASVVPFLAGFPLHDRWDVVGKNILALTMALFLAFIWTAGTCSTFWYYLRLIKKNHRKFAPGSNHPLDE